MPTDRRPRAARKHPPPPPVADGGYGICYWAYYVGFNNTGQAIVTAQPFSALPARVLDNLPERPVRP